MTLSGVAARRVSGDDDYFLARGHASWVSIGISVAATYVSALSFLGAPAWAYGVGLSALVIHVNYPLVMIVCAAILLPFFYRTGSASIYAFLEERFGLASRLFMSAIFVMTQTLTSAAILFSTALVLNFITGFPVPALIVAVGVLALVYTLAGGMIAVIWTDVAQAFILVIGALVIAFALLAMIPGGAIAALSDLKAQGRLQLLDPAFDLSNPYTAWSGIVAMSIFHITVYGANQMLVQRTLGARSLADARKAYLFFGYAALPVYFLFFMIGVLCFAYFQGREFDEPNTIILAFAAESGIPGLTGLLVAAVIAASISTLSSALNSLATVTVVDFLERGAKASLTPDKSVLVARGLTAAWALAVVLPAMLYAEGTGSVLELVSKIGSYFVGAKLGIFALALFSRRVSERNVIIGAMAGFVSVAVAASYTEVAWPWFGLLGGGVNIAVSLTLSCTAPAQPWPALSVPGAELARQSVEQSTPWYRSLIQRELAGTGLVWLAAYFLVSIALIQSFIAVIP